MNHNHYCIIMAGGSGSRLWPASRSSRPKQFLDINGSGKTFLRNTYERFASIIPAKNIIVVTVGKYKELVRKDIPELTEENLLIEPYTRDTAPCIAYATYTLLKRNPDAVTVVTPADHIISDEANFQKAIGTAISFAKENDVLMTLGITPTRPDPNYGYIQVTGGSAAFQKEEAIKVKTFTEKPDVSLAKVFIESGEFFWNSGIFVWKASTIMQEMEKYLPEITDIFKGMEHTIGTPMQEEFINKAYTDCMKISIDYGVMEKTRIAWLCPAKFGWADIGSWESIYSNAEEKDASGNICGTEKSLSSECRNNLLFSTDKKKLIAVKGLENYVVVDTESALLICPKDDRKLKEFLTGLAMPEYEKYR